MERGCRVGECATGRRGDTGGEHHLLRKRLGSFDLGCRGTRPEDQPSLGTEPVGQARGERGLGPHHGEVDAVHVGGIGNAIEIVGRDR
jgi:hypothetical protein